MVVERKSIKVDFHTHSSDLGGHVKSTIDDLLKGSFDVGLDVISITNHYDGFDVIKLSPEKYVSCADAICANDKAIFFERGEKFLYLFRGMEYRGPEGHHLIIGGNKKIEFRDNLRDTLYCAKDKGSIVGPAHPFITLFAGSSMSILESNVESYDFVETFNALSTPKCNSRATAFACDFGLSGISNSDDHVGKPGSSFTCLEGCISGDIIRDVQLIKKSVSGGKIIGGLEKYMGFISKMSTFAPSYFRSQTSFKGVMNICKAGVKYFLH